MPQAIVIYHFASLRELNPIEGDKLTCKLYTCQKPIEKVKFPSSWQNYTHLGKTIILTNDHVSYMVISQNRKLKGKIQTIPKFIYPRPLNTGKCLVSWSNQHE